ncbi:MAG TPA: hypothetical protein VFF66_03790 [Brevundimonas sp.]|nr:hypothetical protein [Brevundimonas sp.]
MNSDAPWRFPVILVLAASLAAAAGWSTAGRATLSPEDTTACRAVVWVMQGAGYERDAGGSVIPVDRRPDLTARADALATALATDERGWTPREKGVRRDFGESAAADLIWQTVEGDVILRGRLGPLADDCERKLGLRL